MGGLQVFDSNIWLHGCLFRNSEPARLVDEAARGHREVDVSAYVFNEVVHRFENPKGRYDRTHTEEAKQLFSDIVVHSESVQAPTQRAVESTDLGEREIQPANQLFARVLDIQAKDAPVLAGAWRQDRYVDLYTCDLQFASCDLFAHGISHIPIHHVEPPK